ncbi:MAG: DUF115 domain-containing protein [Phycisphaeraceae bacterium]|nr:DUF115 domain-containing protein [Phycisphaeraceae bacterium]MCB9848693.1 DUF115 domain-containing protein [Phycisphaeraceae bacterium]
MPQTAPTIQADRVPGRTPDGSILDRNLGALAMRSPRLARAIAGTLPAPGVEFVESSENGALSATYQGAALASRRRPITEAQRLASTVDLAGVGAAVVLGFGLGHHVEALARRARGASLIVVFEPDVALLRAVLERIDFAGMLASGHVTICTAPDDQGAITEAIHGSETLVAMGVRFVEHPASSARLAATSGVFSQAVASVVATVRSQIITTMVQCEMALRNGLMNSGHYCNGLGVADLAGAATGSPAIVVAAGPSLRRNIALLKDPAVRTRCVIIAAQTVLKPLLAEGFRPHFVTALDYHEISARFYEGLTADDLAGVTLVAEPKANPAILASYPGVIRCVGDESLDSILGGVNSTEHGSIKPGATVAHLSCYLARLLGCDPLILVGQDLGFTDGQYYSDGASIHRVWACELNPFRTLEMFEWERIVRSRGILRKATDHLGRPIYTDEQMGSYLTQFEHDFLNDSAQGLTVIDATEGGVRKAHAVAMPLAEAIAAHIDGAPALPGALTETPDRHDPAGDAEALRQRFQTLRQATVRLAGLTRRTGEVLDEIAGHLDDPKRANALIDKAQRMSAEAQANQPAFGLVSKINQTGAFNRIRTDRALRIEQGLDPREEQRRRLERDRVNLRWFADAADSFAAMLQDTIHAQDTGTVRTRIPVADPISSTKRDGSGRIRCVAFLDAALGSGALLERTIERLSRCQNLAGIEVVGADHPARTRTGIERMRAILAARRFAPGAWRGALAGLTCYDECFDPATLAELCAEHNADAALLVGSDWALVDPALCDAVIERHRERPEEHRLTFTQAPPGLAGACVARSLLEEIRQAPPGAGAFASIGGLLAYLPMRPSADRIAKPVCVTIPSTVRDTPGRFIADSPWRAERIGALIDRLGDRWPGLGVEELAAELRGMPGLQADTFPAHTVLSCANGDAALRWLSSARVDRPDAALTLEHPPLELASELIGAARAAGFAAAHLRTGLDGACDDVAPLLGADIVSIDVLATTAQAYQMITGADRFARVIERTERLLAMRGDAGGIPTPWITPRITRRDAVYEQLEPFYDYWLCRAGSAVIDPLPAAIDGERIAPLTVPGFAAGYAARITRRVDPSDGAGA